ncbi:S9 family peptidase [Sphingomonas sp.]|uniref:S9 family peptidase n=1 Tax=Sphingomonas sp. TaxID=28214 RepID=UPI0025E5A220|nr:S9 family peptidase [Sphingomonas sp.]
MKHILFSTAALALTAFTFGTPLAARPMTAADMHMMHRLADPAVSRDGRTALFSLSTTDMTAGKRSTDLYSLDLIRPGATPVRLTATPGENEGSPAFAPDGRSIYYLSSKSGVSQVYRMMRGGKPVQVTHSKIDVNGFLVSPDGAKLLAYADVGAGCDLAGCPTKTATPGSARVYENSGFIRHWDSWATPGEFSRLFAINLASGKATALTSTLTGHAPGKPFGGNEELAWAPDSRSVFFTMRQADAVEPRSTNLDIWNVRLDGSTPTNLTAGNLATDTLPSPSPDGRTLAYVAMDRPGYEADRQKIRLRNLATGETRQIADNWDRSVGELSWAADGRSLIVGADDTLEHPLFRVDIASGEVTRLTLDGHTGNAHPLADGSVVYTSNSIMAPDELYRTDAAGHTTALTAVNRDLLAQLDPVTLDRFNFTGANNDRVWGIKVKPVRNSTLPIAFLVHGGPQGSFGNDWSYRWNPRVMASAGYGVVSVDFHGSTGYGQAFTDAIRNNWGGWPLEDLKAGLAFATSRDPQLQADNACALGASYGGYMMNWIEGNWPDRFRCIVQHDGVFDARAMAYETEELWFDEWEHGGKAYYEDPQAFERWNPVNHVAKWSTPQLVITGEKDFRIPYTQGIAAYTALQRKGIPSRLVVFPDENHWVLKPKNSVQWYGEVLGWMNRWTAPAAR